MRPFKSDGQHALLGIWPKSRNRMSVELTVSRQIFLHMQSCHRHV